MRIAFRALSGVLLLALGAPSGAAAQEARTPDEAVELFRSGREHYQAGRYRDAADELERAQMLDPGSPTLAYNLGRVYELLGSLDRALEQYGRYLQLLAPDQAEERERTESTISRLEGARRSIAAQAEEAPLRELVPVIIVRERGVADLPFWATLVSGGGLLAAGGVLGAIALATHEGAVGFVAGQDGSWQDRQAQLELARGLGVAADVGFAVGGAAIVAALLLFILREREEERRDEGGDDIALEVGLAGFGARW